MNIEARYEALADADLRELEALADEILADGVSVSVTMGPESVSAPVRVNLPGTDDATVVLGHVSLTRCSVLIGGVRGDGIRPGYDPVGAVAAAICDAECERGGSFSTRVREICLAAVRDRAHADRERARVVEMTRLGDS